jgi:ribonuclease BN (tRNA processing enzyme)
MTTLRAAIGAAIAAMAMHSTALAQGCGAASPVSIQILGSNGWNFSPDRVSAGYLLWIDGKARMIVDMGGGTYARYSQSGAKFPDLEVVAISHFHPDHTSDLPALMWAGRLSRSDVLPVLGPSGNADAPSLPEFLRRLFDPKDGAFQVLGLILAPASLDTRAVHLEPHTVDVTNTEPAKVLEKDGMVITALGIPHGNMPAVAYRVEAHGVSVVFSTDQNGANPRFVDFAKGADVLVMHMATNMEGSEHHASPAVLGRIAQAAAPRRLVVSHLGVFDLDKAVAEVRRYYTGPLTVGADLQCTPVR